MPAAEIARELGCSPGYVRATLQRAGLKSRPGKARAIPTISLEEQRERIQDQRDMDMLYDLSEGHSLRSVVKHWKVCDKRLSEMWRESRGAGE